MYSRIAGSKYVPPSDNNIESAVISCGDDLLSMAIGDTAIAQTIADQLRDSGEWLEVVAGIETVVVQFDSSRLDSKAALDHASEQLAKCTRTPREDAELVEIPIVYGGDYGPDFDDVCEQQGLTAKELVALHTGGEYWVDLVGFTPGFAFIGGLDRELNVPRRKEPRQIVPAGSVGIADGRTGLYALAVPGGWQLIGRTPMVLFDANREPPNLLRAGMRIRFVAIDESEL